MIKYKIVEVNQQDHSIVVRYYTDIITEEMLTTDILDGVIRRCRTDYSIDLPIPSPSGEELHKLLLSHAPSDWLNSQELILNPDVDTTMANIVTMLNLEKTADMPITSGVINNPLQYSPELVAIIQKVIKDMSTGDL